MAIVTLLQSSGSEILQVKMFPLYFLQKKKGMVVPPLEKLEGRWASKVSTIIMTA